MSDATQPLVVQRDHTILLEVQHPGYEAARDRLARFAELQKSPEFVHFYKVTPISIWNAAALGEPLESIVAFLNAASRYPVDDGVLGDLRDWYARYEAAFWQDRGWAAGLREWARDRGEDEWGFEIDAGPVLDGFGTSASAFGIAAARRNGRFDHAYTLSAQVAAAGWPLPDGTLLWPRAFSHAADAPYLGEAALAYFLSVQPVEDARVVRGGHLPGLVYVGLLVYSGVTALGVWIAIGAVRRWRAHAST